MSTRSIAFICSILGVLVSVTSDSAVPMVDGQGCSNAEKGFYIAALERKRSCTWISKKRVKKRCSRWPEVPENCPVLCGVCESALPSNSPSIVPSSTSSALPSPSPPMPCPADDETWVVGGSHPIFSGKKCSNFGKKPLWCILLGGDEYMNGGKTFSEACCSFCYSENDGNGGGDGKGPPKPKSTNAPSAIISISPSVSPSISGSPSNQPTDSVSRDPLLCRDMPGWTFNAQLDMGCSAVSSRPERFCQLEGTTGILALDACCVCEHI